MAGNEYLFPQVSSCVKLQGNKLGSQDESLYDVKFWPWGLDGNEQIFAVAGTSQVFVCQVKAGAMPNFNIIRWWNFADDGASINSIAWLKDAETGRPLLCAAGIKPKHILVLDIGTGQVVRHLHGHGSNVNELIACPTLPHVLASCSEDFTIRLWSIHPNRKGQPCIAIFAGEGHRQPLLAAAFHLNGTWLLSGAMDTAVGLWAVPDTTSVDSTAETIEESKTVFYPHFFSNELHHNYVDCVAFYGDLILSRCARAQDERSKDNEILLWRIDGFHADDDPPATGAIAYPGSSTRSAFPRDTLSQGFQRLMTFSMPHTDRFYLRFGLYHAPDHRPILCMGNQHSRFSFWDLQKLETDKYGTNTTVRRAPKGVAVRKKKSKQSMNRTSLLASEASFDSSSTPGRTPSPSIAEPAERRSVLQDPLRPIEPHHTIIANSDAFDRHFATYTVGWSPDGCWAVGVGDFSTMVMLYRDQAA